MRSLPLYSTPQHIVIEHSKQPIIEALARIRTRKGRQPLQVRLLECDLAHNCLIIIIYVCYCSNHRAESVCEPVGIVFP